MRASPQIGLELCHGVRWLQKMEGVQKQLGSWTAWEVRAESFGISGGALLTFLKPRPATTGAMRQPVARGESMRYRLEWLRVR